MALLRIRLQSFAPLPSFRVWFLVPQNAVDVQSLKLAISAQLPALKCLDIQPAHLVLELDGFELLNECSIDLIREDDIIAVHAKETITLDKLECKADVEMASRALKRRRSSPNGKKFLKRSSTPALVSSTSDSSTSDSSTSDSSSSKSSTPYSSSESDSDDFKYLPSPRVSSLPSTKRPQSKDISSVVRNSASHAGISDIQQPTVPPGLGKASTHSRNKRRKLKRKYTSGQIFMQSENLTLPLGINGNEILSTGSEGALRPALRSSCQIASVSITPCSTIRSNKKTDCSLEAKEGTVPQELNSNSLVPTISRCATATFIPPSEREDLPRNIFVTSVEINWQTKQGYTRWQDLDKAEPWTPLEDTKEVFDPGLHQSSDWATIETAWEKYKTLDASTEMLPNTIVGWKAFGLDPVTLTPQVSMLHLGKVVLVDMENIVVQPLTRPNIGRATFGRTSVGEDEEPVEQVTFPLGEVWSNDWKLISYQ